MESIVLKDKKNILIGVGNILFCDDGLGAEVVGHLKENYSFEPELELLDGGTLGFNLLEYFTEYDNVFIVDTISTEGEAGDVYKIPSSELLGGNAYKNTAHEVEVLQMLQACELYDKKADIIVFGVIPEDIISTKIGVSDRLNKRFDNIVSDILEGLKDSGIRGVQRDKSTARK